MPVVIERQPDYTTCGPTSLHAIYRYFGDPIDLNTVIAEMPKLPGGGTLAVHSFTPELHGVRRASDVSFLYDSRRKRESALCRRWGSLLHVRDPALRVRYNYPYLGAADGLPTWFRKQYSEAQYLGVELELNQALLAAPGWKSTAQAIADGLGELAASRVRPARPSRVP